MGSIDGIREKILDAVQDGLGPNLVDKVLEQLIDSAQERIYDFYDQKDYVRRKTFTKEEAYVIDSNGDMEIEITAQADFNPVGNTEANSGNVAELISGGDGNGGSYGWIPPKDRDPTYLLPRPWVDDAKNKIRENNVLKNEIISALRRSGFKVK